FTFQYGATNIINDEEEDLEKEVFTFQYGATNMYILILHLHVLLSYLHSNMVLLILERLQRRARDPETFTFQYGATNISVSHSNYSLVSLFTFQYGATNILG
ncbi:hypothetical protein A500_20039, partial [Clostridium sartagoforme AAU1]